jgi:Mg2+ and Co2+ transporter CorA
MKKWVLVIIFSFSQNVCAGILNLAFETRGAEHLQWRVHSAAQNSPIIQSIRDAKIQARKPLEEKVKEIRDQIHLLRRQRDGVGVSLQKKISRYQCSHDKDRSRKIFKLRDKLDFLQKPFNKRIDALGLDIRSLYQQAYEISKPYLGRIDNEQTYIETQLIEEMILSSASK